MVNIDSHSRRWINITNIFFLSLFLITNLSIFIFSNHDLKILFTNCTFHLILLIVAIYSAAAKSNFGLGILYGLSSITTSFLGDSGNTTGILFVMFSIYIFPNKVFTYFILILNTIAIFLKFIINDYIKLELFNVFLFYIGAYSIFYFLILQHKGGSNGRENRD